MPPPASEPTGSARRPPEASTPTDDHTDQSNLVPVDLRLHVVRCPLLKKKSLPFFFIPLPGHSVPASK